MKGRTTVMNDFQMGIALVVLTAAMAALIVGSVIALLST